MTDVAFEGWVVLELMGHRRLAGYVTEQAIGGQSFVRIDVPGDDGAPVATQFYSGAAVYCITPTTEAIARELARHSKPAPVQRWELEPAREHTAPPEPDPFPDFEESESDDETV
jgi:hypothetical protein